jgi:hypothetical protein
MDQQKGGLIDLQRDRFQPRQQRIDTRQQGIETDPLIWFLERRTITFIVGLELLQQTGIVIAQHHLGTCVKNQFPHPVRLWASTEGVSR